MKNEESLGDPSNKEEQAAYRKELRDRYKKESKAHMEEYRENTKNWTKEEWDQSRKELDGICKELVRLMEKEQPPESLDVQLVTRRHYNWLKKFWTPNQESYSLHGTFIAETELGFPYQEHNPALPKFLGQAIQTFAKKEL